MSVCLPECFVQSVLSVRDRSLGPVSLPPPGGGNMVAILEYNKGLSQDAPKRLFLCVAHPPPQHKCFGFYKTRPPCRRVSTTGHVSQQRKRMCLDRCTCSLDLEESRAWNPAGQTICAWSGVFEDCDNPWYKPFPPPDSTQQTQLDQGSAGEKLSREDWALLPLERHLSRCQHGRHVCTPTEAMSELDLDTSSSLLSCRS